jgi:sugar phosphate isomerase/epimerase
MLPLPYLQAGRIESRYGGVEIGVQSYSFRDRPLEAAINAMADIGLGSCELWQGHVEPRTQGAGTRAALQDWRLGVSLDEFRSIRARFDRAGIRILAYNISFTEDFSDAEIDRGFLMAKALGAKFITSSSNVSTARRIDPLARRHKMRVGMHNHSQIRPNEFAAPEDFARALQGASKYIAVNLDIGHFTAAGFDPLEFLRAHADQVVSLHLKDRKKNQGPNVPFGEGDTPVREVLQFLKRSRRGLPATIEYEYGGADTVAEVRRCLEFCRKALTAE